MARHRQKTEKTEKAKPAKTRGSDDRVAVEDQSAPQQEVVRSKREGPPLIPFDRKTRIFLGSLIFLFLFATAFKLHGSSVGMWGPIWNSKHAGNITDSGVLIGTSRYIRSDEWAVASMAVLSQASAQPQFPVVNPEWGQGPVPLIMGLPVRHWSMLVRPQMWGFFFLDLERAFAFEWNLITLFVLAGTFLLMMLLTENDFWVSLLGSLWVFFSGFMQWWYSTPLPGLVGCVMLVLVAAHYLAFSTRRWEIVVAALVGFILLLNCALYLYPPFQVPLIYFAIFILIGSVVPRLASGMPKDLWLRLGCGAVALGGVGLLLLLYYRDAKVAIEIMRATVYPGKRLVTGGDVPLGQIFGGLYGFFMSDSNPPKVWGNICESSNFLLLFPVPVAMVLWRTIRRQHVTLLEWSLVVYIGIVLSWMTIGWPRAIAAATAWGLSENTRPMHGLGIASIFLCCIFLAKSRADLPKSLGVKIVIAIVLVGIFGGMSVAFNKVTKDFASADQVAFVSLAAATASYLLLARKRFAFMLLVLAPSIWAFALVNPVMAGLGPVVDNDLYRDVSAIVKQDPNARWAVYSGKGIPGYAMQNFFKAAGANVFNGTKFVPPLDDFKVMDANGQFNTAYNRYAHIWLEAPQGDQLSFDDLFQDAYTLQVNPRSELWHALGVRYVALNFQSQDAEFLGKATLVKSLPDFGFWIYKYRW